MPDLLPPSFVFFAGALLLAVAPSASARRAVYLLTPLLAGAQLMALAPGLSWTVTVFSFRMELLAVDRLSLLFGGLFCVAALIAVVFSVHLRDRVQQLAGLVYPGAALGAVFAGDLATLFVHWELLALSSAFLVFARRTTRAVGAGIRYLIFQVLSGVLLLAGTLILWQQTGTLALRPLALDGPGPWLLLAAFGIKCAFPLLHSWLTDAYPEATPTGTVFLAAFTTKAAVYCLLRVFAGAEPLVYIGAAMVLFPVFYAVIEDDLRRMLSYLMVNQLGFMVCGIGIGTSLATSGAAAHAVVDVLFKGVLMMATGAVLAQTGRIRASELGGLARSMPQTAAATVLGAVMLLAAGLVSESMILGAAAEGPHPWLWPVLLFGAVAVLVVAGMQLPLSAFFSRDAGLRPREAPLNMRLAMFGSLALCLAIAAFPQLLYGALPVPPGYQPWSAGHVVAHLQLAAFAALAFGWLRMTGLYPPPLPAVNLDVEWLYRRGAPLLIGWLERNATRIGAALLRPVVVPVRIGWQLVLALTQPAPVRGPEMSTGGMVLVVVAVFAVWLLGYFL